VIAPLCVCALAPRGQSLVRVVIVQDEQERRKTTNTGRLLTIALEQCTVVTADEVSGALGAHAPAWLLFPSRDAHLLAPVTAGEARSLTLVVPDANWPRARRLAARHPSLRGLRRVTLPAGAPSRFLLRHAPRPEQLSTFEAVARALGILEGSAIQESLEQWFRVFVDRTRWTRGDLPASDVTGGIPEAAFSFRGTRRARAKVSGSYLVPYRHI
jgi:DTW domain-containing protein YfiP